MIDEHVADQRERTVSMTPADITAELAKFIHPTAVVELRALNVGGPRRTVAGWFDGRHLHDLARTALALTRQSTGVYFTPNPVNPALLARCPNRAEEVRGGRTSRVQLTTDADVIERRYLIVDLDPVRTSEPDEPDEPTGPAEQPTTDAELATAMLAAVEVIEELRGHDWAWPMWMRSGNGVNLVFPLAGAIPAKMPAGQSDRIRDTLAMLRGSNFRGRDLAVRIGETTHAAATLLPVPGTWARCGEQSAGGAGGGERRHRTAAVLETPDDWPMPDEAVVVAGAVATDARSDDASDDTDREAGTRYANADGDKPARVRRPEVASGDRVGDKPAKSRAKRATVAQNGTPAIFE